MQVLIKTNGFVLLNHELTPDFSLTLKQDGGLYVSPEGLVPWPITPRTDIQISFEDTPATFDAPTQDECIAEQLNALLRAWSIANDMRPAPWHVVVRTYGILRHLPIDEIERLISAGGVR